MSYLVDFGGSSRYLPQILPRTHGVTGEEDQEEVFRSRLDPNAWYTFTGLDGEDVKLLRCNYVNSKLPNFSYVFSECRRNARFEEVGLRSCETGEVILWRGPVNRNFRRPPKIRRIIGCINSEQYPNLKCVDETGNIVISVKEYVLSSVSTVEKEQRIEKVRLFDQKLDDFEENGDIKYTAGLEGNSSFMGELNRLLNQHNLDIYSSGHVLGTKPDFMLEDKKGNKMLGFLYGPVNEYKQSNDESLRDFLRECGYTVIEVSHEQYNASNQQYILNAVANKIINRYNDSIQSNGHACADWPAFSDWSLSEDGSEGGSEIPPKQGPVNWELVD